MSSSEYHRRQKLVARATGTAGRIPFFPQLLPDELLFSAMARFHRLMGGVTGSNTTALLFGVHKALLYSATLVPPNILIFASRMPSDHANRNAVVLLSHNTPFNVLTYFEPKTRRQFLVKQYLYQRHRGPSRIVELGLRIAQRSHPRPGLAFCDDCVKEDIARFGVGYWHVEHQLPGYYFCARHQRQLAFSDTERTSNRGVVRAPILPQAGPNGIFQSRPIALPDGIPKTELLRIASSYAYLINKKGGFDGGDWVTSVRRLLTSEGFSRGSTFNLGMLTELIRARLSPGLRRWIGFEDHSNYWFHCALGEKRPKRVWNAIALSMVFSDNYATFEDLLKLCNSKTSANQIRLKRGIDYLARIESLAKSSSISPRHLLVGNSKGHKREQVVADKRSLAIELLRTCLMRHNNWGLIESRFCMARSELHACLQTPSSTFVQRQMLKRAQTDVLIYRNTHPAASLSIVRSSCGGQIRHIEILDPDWLTTNLPRKRHAPRKSYRPEYDKSYSKLLESASLRLLSSPKSTRLSLSAITSEAGLHHLRNIDLKLMPESMAVLKRHVETREQFWKRRFRVFVTQAGAQNFVISEAHFIRKFKMPGLSNYAEREQFRDLLRAEVRRQGFHWSGSAKRARKK